MDVDDATGHHALTTEHRFRGLVTTAVLAVIWPFVVLVTPWTKAVSYVGAAYGYREIANAGPVQWTVLVHSFAGYDVDARFLGLCSFTTAVAGVIGWSFRSRGWVIATTVLAVITTVSLALHATAARRTAPGEAWSYSSGLQFLALYGVLVVAASLSTLLRWPKEHA